MHIPSLLVSTALLALALPAQALLIRSDRDDAEYLELATRYTSYVDLKVPDGGGVLVTPRWVLTAAHMAVVLQEKRGHRLRIGQGDYEVTRVYIHPEWKKGGPSDIALLLLAKDVRGVDPTPIYRAKDEGGKGVVIVGSGYNGRIGEKPWPKEKWDRKVRAAINTVDRLSPLTLGLKIKAGDDASDLQGAAAPGDSGGPAYIQTDAGLFVAGIGYATDDTNANKIVGDPGDWEIYARVSAFAEWIDKTMYAVAQAEAEALLGEK